MKKNLLLFAAMATATSALAVTPNQQTAKQSQRSDKVSVTNKANRSHKVKDLLKTNSLLAPQRGSILTTRSGETLNMQWGYCYDPYTAENFEDNEVNQAIYVAPEFTEKLDGALLKNVWTGNPADASDIDYETYTYGNPVKTCKVWVRETLEGDPVAEGEGEMGPYAFDWSSIALSEPYTIEKGKPFYVGITYTLPADNQSAYGYVTDFMYPAEYDNTNLIYSAFEKYDQSWNPIFGSEKRWVNIGYEDGNACIRLDVFGDNLPTNIVNIDDFLVEPYVKPGDKVEVMLSVSNQGANAIKDVEISLQYSGEDAQTVKSVIYNAYDYDFNLIEGEIPYGYTGLAVAEFECPKAEGNYSYEIKITKINGEGDNNSESEVSGYLLCLAEGYYKNVVVEEATGLWCGYCPIGYAGMEYLKENFTEDGVIGVALHGGDVMDVLDEDAAFSSLYEYISGYPSCYYNRNMSVEGYPSPEYFEEDIPALIEVPAMASISASLEATDEQSTVKLNTKSDFLLNGAEGEYEIGYTVVEDGVGPYMQTNYLSGEDDEDSYGFGSKNDPCLLKFNDVARNCSQPMGIEGSLPAVEKGKSYDYACEIKLDDVKNYDNYRVVAMVINKKSGRIENATVVNSPSYSGVKETAISNTGAFVRSVKGGIVINGDHSNVNIYSASGMKVAKAKGFRVELPAGIYIVTRGTESVKVVVK